MLKLSKIILEIKNMSSVTPEMVLELSKKVQDIGKSKDENLLAKKYDSQEWIKITNNSHFRYDFYKWLQKKGELNNFYRELQNLLKISEIKNLSTITTDAAKKLSKKAVSLGKSTDVADLEEKYGAIEWIKLARNNNSHSFYEWLKEKGKLNNFYRDLSNICNNISEIKNISIKRKLVQ